MENFKTRIVQFTLVLLSILFFNSSQSQSISQGELIIVNNTGTIAGKFIKVDIYPVGAIFSGGNQYSLDARYPINIQTGNTKILGNSDILNFNQNLSEDQWTSKINFDASSLFQDCEISLGYGKYRIDFYAGPDQDNFTFVDYCIIDYNDANYGTGSFQGEQKIRIDFRPLNLITFNFLSSSIPRNITEVGRNIRVWEQYGSGFPPVVPSKGMFNDTTLAQYRNFPIDARDFGAIDHITPSDFNLNMTVKYQGGNLKQNQTLNFLNSSMTINENIVFVVNSNREFNFSGKDSKFITKANSELQSPENFVIRVKDTAAVVTSFTKFTIKAGSSRWGGLRLDNINSASSIANSTFEYADTSVRLYNQLSKPFTFEQNTVRVFRTNAVRKVGVHFRNCFNLLIQQNNFHLPEGYDGFTYELAVHLTNNVNLSDGEVSNINIIQNNFYDGVYQLNILGFASNLIPVYISENSFNDGNSNIILRRCIGDIKYNSFANSIVPVGLNNASIVSFQSQAAFFVNTIQYPEYDIISSNSYTFLAPVSIDDGKIIWTGGYNDISNLSRDNIYSDNNGYVFADQGRNSFRVVI